MPASSGTAEDLLKFLRASRLSGQGRSPLAAPFTLSDVDIAAHKGAQRDEIGFVRQADSEVNYLPQVMIRYSRLVDTVKPREISEFVELLRTLSAHPDVVRLNRTKQLGTTSISGNIGAGHSRLEHSLGVLDIALLFCNRLTLYFDKYPDDWSHRRAPILRVIAIFAFFHDAFHGPYGHTMDPIRFIIDPDCTSDRLDKAALIAEITRTKKKSGWLWEALLLVYEEVFRGKAMKAKDALEQDISLLHDMLVLRDKNLEFAREIVDSVVDADRLDYVPRDQGHLFLGERLNFQDLVDHCRFIRVNNLPQLHFSDEYEAKIWHLLAQRLFLYDTIYEATAKVPYDEMMLHAVLFLFEDFGCGLQVMKSDSNYPWRVQIAEEFSRLSDEDLERLFEQIPSTPKLALARLLLQDLRANAPFSVVAVEAISPKGMAAMRIRVNQYTDMIREKIEALSAEQVRLLRLAPEDEGPETTEARKGLLERIISATQGEAFYETHDQLEFDYLKEYAKQAEDDPAGGGRLWLSPVKDEHLYWMCLLLSDNMSLRRNFEYILWRKLRKRWERYEFWRNEVVSVLAKSLVSSAGGNLGPEQYLETSKKCKQLIDDTALVFVAGTKIPPTIRDIVLRHRAKEAPLRFHDEDDATRLAAEPWEKAGSPSYHLRMVAPSSLVSQAREVAEQVWREAVDGWEWFTPDVLEGSRWGR